MFCYGADGFTASAHPGAEDRQKAPGTGPSCWNHAAAFPNLFLHLLKHSEQYLFLKPPSLQRSGKKKIKKKKKKEKVLICTHFVGVGFPEDPTAQGGAHQRGPGKLPLLGGFVADTASAGKELPLVHFTALFLRCY